MGTTDGPSLAEHVCLALVAEGPTHGWALVRLLAPDGDLGRIWSLSRPLTYRAVDQLVDAGLVRRRAASDAAARRRSELRVTAAGRRVDAAWLEAPVRHLRDVRTELLLKLVLRDRRGLPRAALLEAQRQEFAPLIAALASRETHDPVEIWRRESASAVARFLAACEDASGGPGD